VDAVDLTACLTDAGLEGVCRSGTCAGIACGNHNPDPGEECDDGNTTDGDGCDTDCTWSCDAPSTCDDERPCNGAETCNMTTHVCQNAAPLANGTECDRDGNPATRDICLTGLCGLSICSDGFVDTAWGEFCDDGNLVNGDGCESSCVWTCTTSPNCDDLDPCSGAETCNTTTHVCRSGTPQANGTDCTSAGVTAGRCRDGTCAPITCGNAGPDPGEECDDGNTTDGDGCETTCVYSCHAAADCPEAPTDNPCTTDTCVTGGTGQICRHTPNTDPCNDGDACTSPDLCSAGSCVGTPIDADGDTYGPGVACGGDCNDAAAAVHPGATETCNGVDDNCNGTTDDGTGMTCAQGSSRSCTSGPCTGTEACVTATCVWSGDCVLAATESCNGSDDDCDGFTDEGFACILGSRETCTPTGGGSGNRTCISGCVWGVCTAGVEVACNNIDDDADTVTDEGSWCLVTGVPTVLDLYGIGGSASNDVWVVGATGTILHWNGSAWATETSGVLVNLEDAWAASTTDAWAVGATGTILYWNGAVWTPESAGGYTGSLNAVWGSSASDVWAAGNAGKILRRTGWIWVDSASGTTRHLYGVWGLTTDFVWAVGVSATVRRWDGTTWTDASPAGTTSLSWVSGSSTTDVWAVGLSGYIFHWNGTAWSSSRNGVSAFNGVWAASPSLAWVVGAGGAIRMWNGTAWGLVTSGTSNHLNAVWGASAAEVWAVGAAGTIVRWRQ
jgi:cysteine-rich repeat protein